MSTLFFNRYCLGVSLGLGLILFFSCNSTCEPTITSNTNIQADSITEQAAGDFFASSEKTLEQDSLNIELRNILATHYYIAKNYERAIYHFLIIHELDKKNLSALIGLGNAYYDMQQNEKAVEFYEKVMAVDTNNFDVRCDLATCYLRMNQTEKAISILKENIKMNYKHAQSHYNLSVFYKQIGKNQESDEEMKIYNQLTADQKNSEPDIQK